MMTTEEWNDKPAGELTDLERVMTRLRRIAFYKFTQRNHLIHNCALGAITMGDIQDLLTALDEKGNP